MSLVALSQKYDTDKSQHDHYLRAYEGLVGPFKDQPIKLLELGVFRGGSLYMWRDYLPQATIVGLDIDPIDLHDSSGRVRFYQGEQQDVELLNQIAADNAPEGFDVIIDDASHVGQYTRIAFWHLFQNHLKPGGLYMIEDWGASYWNILIDGKQYRPRDPDFSVVEKALNSLYQWPAIQGFPFFCKVLRRARWHLVKKTFPSHTRGMVGFVKELVDECGMGDITHPKFGIQPHRLSRIKEMRISHGHVIVCKSRQA